jgi:hypothetical protein
LQDFKTRSESLWFLSQPLVFQPFQIRWRVPRCFQWNRNDLRIATVKGASANPEGIEAFSPGLRGMSYPGTNLRKITTLKEGVREFDTTNSESIHWA